MQVNISYRQWKTKRTLSLYQIENKVGIIATHTLYSDISFLLLIDVTITAFKLSPEDMLYCQFIIFCILIDYTIDHFIQMHVYLTNPGLITNRIFLNHKI